MEISIRQISKEDAPAISILCSQLGYVLSIEQILKNIQAILENEFHNAFVAVHKDEIVGWIGVAQAFQIESPSFCEVRGLVVDERYRKQGIGKILIEKAKKWGREKQNRNLRLRCNVKRSEAHLFYRHLGFEEIKQQKVFEVKI
jgi:GNAT superfamily N-acetyltransferase